MLLPMLLLLLLLLLEGEKGEKVVKGEKGEKGEKGGAAANGIITDSKNIIRRTDDKKKVFFCFFFFFLFGLFALFALFGLRISQWWSAQLLSITAYVAAVCEDCR